MSEPKIELLNMDCMEFMKGVPDKAFDLAIVDPPYGLGKTWGKSSCKKHGNRHKYITKKWNDFTPDDEYFYELYRISKNQIIWGCNYFPGMITDVGRIVWDKKSSQDITSSCDLASQSFSNKIDIFRFMWDGYRMEIFQERIHPTEKPITLYKWLLKKYATAGDKIFDSHGGSMSSAIACHQMGFDLVLTEIDKEYYDAGVKRFREQTKQISLFKP